MGWRRTGPDVATAGALFLGAVLARLTLLEASPYGDEAVHFYMAKTLGVLDDRIVWAGSGVRFHVLPFVFGRPVFALGHLPGTFGGFHGFRLLGATYAALLPPIAFMVLRQLAVARWLSAGAGTAIALHPTFVVWGARIFPDSLMALFALLAIWAWIANRPVLGSAFVVLACWTKESALAVAIGLAALALLGAFRKARAAGTSPLDALAERGGRASVIAVALGAIPLVLGYAMFPRLPGWAMGGDLGPSWESLWLSSWLSLAPLVALKVRRARPLAAAGLGLAAFYLAFHGLRGGSIQGWFAVLPGIVGLLACAVVVDAGLKSQDWPRMVAPALAVAAAFAMATAVVGSMAMSSLTHPLAPAGASGLAGSIAFVQEESPEVHDVWEFQRSLQPGDVLELDLMWFWVGFPVAGSESTKIAYPVLTPDAEVPVEQLATQAEESDLVWMQDWNGTFGRAFRQTYADCEAFSAGNWIAFQAQNCPGRGERLRASFDTLATTKWS